MERTSPKSDRTVQFAAVTAKPSNKGSPCQDTLEQKGSAQSSSFTLDLHPSLKFLNQRSVFLPRKTSCFLNVKVIQSSLRTF